MITYTVDGWSFEVEIREDKNGDVVLSVGDMPILYLNPKTKMVHLVPNDVADEVGLEYEGKGPWVSIVRDRHR